MKGRIVLVGQVAIEHLESDNLAQFQGLQQRYPVQKLAGEIPLDLKRSIAVVDELQVLDHVEHIAGDDIGVVGHWHQEQRERCLVPGYGSTEVKVDASIGIQPDAFEDSQLSSIVVIVAAHDTLETDGMSQGEDWIVVVDVLTTMLGVDDLFAGSPAQGKRQLAGSKML
jgi:hypothetical protein